jgi:hypothetical protein
MWIVMYIAMMASLDAMGLSLIPIDNRELPPYKDM